MAGLCLVGLLLLKKLALTCGNFLLNLSLFDRIEHTFDPSEGLMTLAAGTHPVLACVAEIEGSLKAVADVNPMFMTSSEKGVALVALHRLESQVAALKLRVLAVAQDVADADGARDAGAWLAHHAQADVVAVRAELELARDLEEALPVVAVALGEGTVSVAQATVIAHAIDALPSDVPAETIDQAERWLVDASSTFAPKQLRVLGRRILDVIDPTIAEAAEARRLADEEAHAARATRLSIKPLGDGTTRVTAVVADAVAVRLRTYLEAFAQPRVASADTNSERLPRNRALGEALGQLLEVFDPARLPLHGGDATTVVVTIPLEQLQRDLGVAEIGDDRVTAAQARRLACTAGIIPAVLGGKSEVLDLGRQRRLFTPGQRKALRLRDRQCRAEGCTIPATWCDAHHLKPWSHGGSTDLDDGVLLCRHHHQTIHDPSYEHTWLPNGRLRYHRAA